jgi:pimeloyl-ACP methyl ester carboxylesterase
VIETRFLELPEGTLAYSDYGGNGPLVLMLPGMGALRSEYRYLAPRLSSAGYRSVAVDLRGHGESSVPWAIYDVPSVGGDILALTEHLGAPGAHVIGTSFAAGPAVWLAAERPDVILSLVLIGAFVRAARISPVMNVLFRLMVSGPWRVHAWVAYYGTLYPTRKPADFRDYLSKLSANMAEPGRFQAARALAFSSREPSAERLAQVQAPTLVVMGTKDRDFPDPAAEGRYIAEQTGGQLALIEGAGHYPQTEMPEKVGPVIIDFFKRSSQQSESIISLYGG